MTDEQIKECWQEAEQESRLTGMFISRTWLLYGQKVAAKAQAELQERLTARIAELERAHAIVAKGRVAYSAYGLLATPPGDHMYSEEGEKLRREWISETDAYLREATKP